MSGSRVEQPALGVVVLAAGRSTRMGKSKMLLPWGETTVIGNLIDQWTRLGSAEIAVVCAGGDERLAAELDRLGFPERLRLGNPEPERGMFSSIQCACRWAGWDATLTHWAIVLGDQPHLRTETLRRLLLLAAQNPTKVCQPSRASRPKHPVILPRRLFSALGSAPVPSLKAFLSAQERALCEIDDPALDIDIDTPTDYEKALRLRPREG